MTASNVLTASLEDYLEVIFQIIADKQVVRPKDIAKCLKVSNPSVTGALRSLAGKGLINYAPYDAITLTPAGEEIALDIVRRHEVLRDFLINVLSVDERAANEAACKMEHFISRHILERLFQFVEFVETCPRGGVKWATKFGYHCDPDATQETCERCVSAVFEEEKPRNRQRRCKTADAAMLEDL